MKSSRPLQKAPFGFRVSLSAPISSAQSPSHSQRPAAPTAFDKGDAAGVGKADGKHGDFISNLLYILLWHKK